MKPRLFTFLFVLVLGLNVQSQRNHDPTISLKSVMFGNDITINGSIPNQQLVAIAHAFNGWLFAAITYTNEQSNLCISVMKSTDNGLTWSSVLGTEWWLSGNNISSIDISTIGNTVSDLKYVLSYVTVNDPSLKGMGNIVVQNGASVKMLCSNISCYDISLASGPNGIGILYSKYEIGPGTDSIIFRSMSNGDTLDSNWQAVSFTGNYFHRVDLAYGKCSSYEGYFATWEEQDANGYAPGHIYTSNNTNGTFTTPVNLDGLNDSDFGNCSNPSISCQHTDNGELDLTEVIVFEKYEGTCNIIGYCNTEAVNSDSFNRFIASDSLNNNIQPDICFDPYDLTFKLTYYDSTSGNLPFLIHDFNMSNPNNWTLVSTGYNDINNLSAPNPSIEVTPDIQAVVWIGGSNGVAMFDSPNYYPTILTKHNKNKLSVKAYPNPCYDRLNISFFLETSEIINIEAFNILGQYLGTISSKKFTEGNNNINYSVSSLPSGNLIIRIRSLTTGCQTNVLVEIKP